MTQENIERLGILEQNLSSVVMQRQSFQKQLLELEYAHKELEGKEDAYQIVGTIMIKKSATDLQESIVEQKETISVKLKSIVKQEAALRSQLQDLQTSVMAQMQGSKNE